MIAKLADVMGVKFAVSESFLKGGEGAVELAKAVKETIAENHDALQYIYDLDDDIKDKITKLAVNYYGAGSVEFSEQALKIEAGRKVGKGTSYMRGKNAIFFQRRSYFVRTSDRFHFPRKRYRIPRRRRFCRGAQQQYVAYVRVA